MSNCVAFNCTNSSPSIYRNSGTRPASNDSSGRMRCRVPAYADFGDFVVIEGVSSQYALIEFAAAGTLYAATRNGSSPANNTRTIWSDSYTGWFDLVWVANSGGFYVSVRRAGGAWSDILPCTTVNFSVSSIRFAGSFLFVNSVDAQHRIACIEVFGTALPGGSSDVTTARNYLKGLCDSRGPGGDASTIFYNNCVSGSLVHVDGSVLASDFTAVGTPTTITNDDPAFNDTLVLAAPTNSSEVPEPTIPVGDQVVLVAPPNTSSVPTPGMVFAQSIQMAAPTSSSSVPIPATYYSTSLNLLLSASANNRYLQNANGVPVFLFGDSCWSIITNLSDDEQDIYLNDRQARGVNALMFQGIENEFGNNPPENTDGEPPFTGVAFQTPLNEPYWARHDAFLARMAARGMVACLNPIYIGFNDSQGWGAEVGAATTGQIQSYGAALGTRLKDFDNIIYCVFGDRNALGSRMDALVTGIKSTDTRHTLFTAHYSRPTSTHNAAVPSYVTYNYLYPATGLAHNEAIEGYTANIGPMILGEDRYEHATGITAFEVRRGAWQAALAGSLGGVFVGNEGVWAFDWNPLFPGLFPWTDYLDDLGLIHAQHVARLFSSIAFHTLVPEGTGSTFITAGRGTFASAAWVPGAKDAAGTVAAIYAPAGSSFTLNMGLLAGSMIGHWLDPTNGARTLVTGSPFANSGSRAFVASSQMGTNAAGGADWVLVLELQSRSVVLAVPANSTSVPTPTGLAASSTAVLAAPSNTSSVPTPSLLWGYLLQLAEPPNGGHVPVPFLAGQSQIVLSAPASSDSVPQPLAVMDLGHSVQMPAPVSSESVPEPSILAGVAPIIFGAPPNSSSVPAPLVYEGSPSSGNPRAEWVMAPGPSAEWVIEPGPSGVLIFPS